MTYYDKYHCVGCPVSKWCGTAVSCFKLCHSYNDDVAEKEHILTLSAATPDINAKCSSYEKK